MIQKVCADNIQMISPDFARFSPEQCLNQFIYHIFLEEIPNSYFFLKTVPKELYIPKINSLCDVLNADDTSFPFIKWILLCFVSRLSKETENQLNNDNEIKSEKNSKQIILKKPIISDSFYLYFLDSKRVKSKEATILQQIFTGKSDFFQKNKASSNSKSQNSDDKKSVIQAIAYLFEKHKGLYTALLRHGFMEALLLRIGPELLFNYFEIDSFSLKETFDDSYIPYFSIKLINSTNFDRFWSQLPIIFDSKSSQLFQSLFACDSPFPRFSKFFPENELNDAILSLTNDVLTKKNKSFIDIILVICRTLIIDGLIAAKDQECFLTYTKQFPDLRIISFLSEYESIKNEPVFENAVIQVTDNLNPEPNSISEIDPNSIMTDVMQRFKNDINLCFFLTNAIGRKTKTVDLEKVSLPRYIIENAYLELIDCSSFNDKKLFVINDKDRKKDFVFIYLYKALCLIVNQIHDIKKIGSQLDFSEISTTDSISEISSTELLSTFSKQLITLIEFIKSFTNDETFEKIIIELFSVLFITEKEKFQNENDQFNSFVFTDNQITEIISILFHFCPKQKEIRKAFLKFKFIKTLSQKNFEEAKSLVENENDNLYKIALTAELISKISNSEQWSFPTCIDKSFFDAEYFLSNNEDFGADMSNICSELTILIGKRRVFKKRNKYMPYKLYDVENTINNIKAFNSLEYEKIKRDQRCIQFNDFIDFERKLNKSGNQNLNDINDIFNFEIKNDEIASLLTLKTVPEKYKNNKIINYIFNKTNKQKDKNENNNFNGNEIQSIEDILDYLKKCDENLLLIDNSTYQILLQKCFSFDKIPYDVLNDLYIRNEKIVLSFYNTLIHKFKIIDFIQIMPFYFYRSISKISTFQNFDKNMNLNEFLEYLIVNKKFMYAKQLAEDFHLSTQLDLLIKENISTEDYQTIELTFPHLKEYIKEMKRKNEKEFIPSEIESNFMNQLHEFMKFNEDDYLTTFLNLFSLLNSIKSNLETISTPLMNQIVEIVTILLSSTTIDSLEAEFNAISILYQILNFLKLFRLKMENLSDSSKYQTLLYQLECLSKLVCCNFNASFNEVFSFDNFFSKQQGASYASLCQKYDQISILRDIQKYWCLNDYRFFDSVLNCIKLGLIKNYNNELKEAVKAHLALKIDCQILANDLIPILSFVQPFSITNYVNEITELSENNRNHHRILAYFLKVIEENTVKEFNIDLRKVLNSFRENDISEKENAQLPIIHIASPQVKELDVSLSTICAYEDRILFHCQFGDFDEAFNLFSRYYLKSGNVSINNSGINNSSLSVFMRVLITPAIAFKQWNAFWRKFIRFLNVYEKVIDDFINFLGQNQMYYILFDVEKRIEYNDNALYAAIKLFERANSWQKQKEILKMMSALIQKSLSLNKEEDKKKHKSFFSLDSILQLQRRTNVQLAIISMFINTNVPFDKSLELMTSKENTINLASFLLLRYQIGYFLEICELPDISIEEICENAIEILNSSSRREEGAVSRFFKNLTKLDNKTYRKLIMCLSKSIYRRVPDEVSFVEFVRRNIKGDDLIVAVLNSFGFEKEADEILKRRAHK